MKCWTPYILLVITQKKKKNLVMTPRPLAMQTHIRDAHGLGQPEPDSGPAQRNYF